MRKMSIADSEAVRHQCWIRSIGIRLGVKIRNRVRTATVRIGSVWKTTDQEVDADNVTPTENHEPAEEEKPDRHVAVRSHRT